MLFLNLPDAAPVLVHETVPIAASSAVSNVRTDGICEFTWADTDPDYKPRSMFMDYSSYMLDLLPKDFVESHLGLGMSADDLKWLKEWDKGMEIKIVRAPKHGQMIIDDSMDADYPSYVPDKNFVGRDSVEVLVSAKDLQGRPISKKLVYFINVLPQKEMDKVVSRHKAMVKKYCGTSKPDWRISGSASPNASLTRQ